jgi:hypothetical protein
MDSHAHFDRRGIPCFLIQQFLGVHGGIDGINGRVKSNAKGIPNDLEDMSIVSLHGLIENGVVSGAQCFPLIAILFCDFGAAFDVGE